MYKTGTEIKVGLFVVAALATLAWMTFRLGGFHGYQDQSYQVDAVFTQASGLKTGVVVQVAGIPVGRVESIELVNDQARIIMSIRQDVRLPIDSRALIKSQGVLGDKYIEIAPGQEGGQSLSQGDSIVDTKAADDLTELMEKLGSVAEDLKSLTSALAADGGGEELRSIITNVKSLSESLDKLVTDNSSGLTETLASLGRSAGNLESITDKIASGQGTLGRLVNDDGLIKELTSALHGVRQITDGVKQITDKIAAGEGTIGRLVNDDSTIDKIDEALTGVNEYLAKDKETSVSLEVRTDFMTRYNYLKTTANARIQTSPDRWYLLGVTSDFFGRYSRTDYTSGGNSWERESFERGRMKFNAQIAQRYYDFVIRGGVFESGAGLALDWYPWEDLTLTFEAFSGDFDHNPHLRALATWRFWKFLYVGAGYDDIISDQNRGSPFISFGLSFTDDDLKYILGGASSILK
ncbi:MAG: MCE family protein [Deltaproteobacteria bacterium]|jgi:phospholipid/cholesterol/gamma-HCH transport system substrate-binding protein|nr:MCE family protein [Deltaproteobacteria bacterium]